MYHDRKSPVRYESCPRVPSLSGKGREEGPGQVGSRRNYLLADWLQQKNAGVAAAKANEFGDVFSEAPRLNPARKLITGMICGIRVEDIKEPTMQEIRYLDKLIDELAKGKAMDRILRK